MKKIFIKIVESIVKVEIIWFLIDPITYIATLVRAKRNQYTIRKTISSTSFQEYAKQLTVLNGPFKNMKYPSLQSVGSALFPKLLGSYEHELHSVIKTIIDKRYELILDIGCAEGYYAVGLALCNATSKVIGFDLNNKALKLCHEMAVLNQVSDRVDLKKKCTDRFIANYDFKNRSLIISDCEGFEKELFNSNNITNLSAVDLLIETHDFIDIEISTYLKKLFANTHQCHSILSVDDLEKAKTYQFLEIENLSLNEKRAILSEGRPSTMEWLFFESLHNSKITS